MNIPNIEFIVNGILIIFTVGLVSSGFLMGYLWHEVMDIRKEKSYD